MKRLSMSIALVVLGILCGLTGEAQQSARKFVPVTDAMAYYGEERITGTEVDTFLVNRRYLRRVDQVDRRTGEAHQRLPGT